MTTKDNGGAAHMTPAELLATYDDLMAKRRQVTQREREAMHGMVGAATFAAAAYEALADRDAATIAMMRIFLVALVDPMHPDLDYLRQDPAAAAAAREATA